MNLLQRFSLFVFLLCGAAGMAAAQGTGSVKGFVYDRASGEPLVSTSVFLRGTSYGVQTDPNGYFSITQVPVGEYMLIATFTGYDSASADITINNNQVLTKKLYLRGGRELGEVRVSGTKLKARTQSNVGITTLTTRDITRPPSAGGEPDVAQVLQITPGVVFTGDQGGQLYIRGGAPSQTGILLDGVTIYNPFHTIGLYSVFETDAIRSADVYTAGFNAQYGNRTSAILDIRTKDGNKNRLSGKVSASPIMGRVLLEGPISKPKSDEGGSTTFLIAAKHSYLDATSKNLYGGLSETFNNGLPYTFTDLYGKVSFNGSNGSKLNLFGFNFKDDAQFLRANTNIPVADFDWTATGAGATFVVSPGNSSALINGKFAYSKYGITYDEASSGKRSSGIDGFEGGIDFTNFLPGYSQLRYGVEVSGLHTNLDYKGTFGNNTTLDRQNTLAALYVMFRKNFSQKFVFEPGIRFQYYATLGKISPEPRIDMKYNITRNIRLKAAAGMYSQNIISTKTDKDIVNFFTGFLLSPDQSINKNQYDVNGTSAISNNLLTAYHLLGGIEVDVKSVEFNLEPWYKNFTQNIELNRYKGAINPNATASDPDDKRFDNRDFIVETGKAYGVDLSAKYSQRRLYLWGVVSYQYVDRNDGQQTYSPPFDRRFNMNLLGSYTAGKKKDWELSLRYNLGSPFPFTQTQGFYENLGLVSNGLSTNYLQQNGQLGLIYANDINGGRLSWYHRVDASVKKRFTLSRTTNVEANFSVTNVTNRNNIFYVDRVTSTRVYQLPLFPSLAVSLNF